MCRRELSKIRYSLVFQTQSFIKRLNTEDAKSSVFLFQLALNHYSLKSLKDLTETPVWNFFIALFSTQTSRLSLIMKASKDRKDIYFSTIYEICLGLNIEFRDFFKPDYMNLENIED